ncbi:hypothetical protein CsSME_00043503 [Camellia sinensis var. sinensis]
MGCCQIKFVYVKLGFLLPLRYNGIYRIPLAVNIQIPFDCGGLGGKAIYIDTEGSFMVEHALQIAEACMEDVLEYYTLWKKFQACQVQMQPEDFLNNILYFRICSYTKQIAMINYLEKFISEHKDVDV